MFSGEVALLKEKTHRKPKSKRSTLPAPEPIAGPSNYPHALNHSNHSQAQPQSQGSKDVPIALLSDGEEAGEKRRTRVSGESPNGKKKRRVVDIVRVVPFHGGSPLIIFLCSTLSTQTSKLLLRISKRPSRKVCTRCHTHLSSRMACTCFGRELGAERQISSRNSSNTCRCCAQGDQTERIQ